MKVIEIKKDRHYRVTRTEPNEKWPQDWAAACGLAEPRKVLDLNLDGDSFHVWFEPNREMIIKWAESLPNRMAILKFWEWMQKESPSFKEVSSGYDIEKLLDRYHEINRTQLDDERRALLE